MRSQPALSDQQVGAAMRWAKTDGKWIAANGKIHCEIRPPPDPADPIQKYSWSVRRGSNRVSGGTQSLAESKQAAEQEVAVLKHREQMK
jgi:hypothetical protein